MIKSELIAKLAAENPHLTGRDVERVVSTIIERMIRSVWMVTTSSCGSQVTPKVVSDESPSAFSTLRTRRL